MRLNYIDNIDCLEGLREVPDQSVDAIITDPPYFLDMGHAGCKETASKNGIVNGNRTFGGPGHRPPLLPPTFQRVRPRAQTDRGLLLFHRLARLRVLLPYYERGAAGQEYDRLG